jgi:endoribonuclease LACTB2
VVACDNIKKYKLIEYILKHMSFHVINVGYESANFYIIMIDGIPKIMIDCGYANTMSKLEDKLKSLDIQLEEIKYLLITHYHPDHAGLVKELKSSGMKLVVYETQLPSVKELANPLNLTEKYIEMQQKDCLLLKAGQSREFLKKQQIDGEIIQTTGHTHDSISLMLDEAIAFTGDLPLEMMLSEDDNESRESWEKLRKMGVHSIYPGHGKVQNLQ